MTSSTAYKPVNAWERYAGEREEAFALAARYVDFLTRCKTERETVDNAQKILRDAGFEDRPGAGRFMRSLRGKALFAARRGSMGLEEDGAFRLIAAHADSPRLDFKQRPFLEQAGVAQAKTHYYGGIRKYQWLARPLALHGVVALENGTTLEVRIGEDPGEPVFCVADLLPHLAQKQSEQKLRDAFDAEKLNIIIGHEPAAAAEGEKDGDAVKKNVLDYLHEKYGLREEDFITAELEAVPAGSARHVGLDRALIGGYGQDDRICVFAALEALLAAQNARHTLAVIFWDKEEIGSDGATGASSRFLQYCVEDLALERSASASRVFLNGVAVSADVQAALDPDFQDVHEKQNAALIGHGPCFSKFTGSRGKYGASDADAEYFAWLRSALNAKKIPWQAAELGKVDLGGGGTVALFLAAYGMRVIDLGPALLSMHSPFELSSVMDLYATARAYTAFYEA